MVECGGKGEVLRRVGRGGCDTEEGRGDGAGLEKGA